VEFGNSKHTMNARRSFTSPTVVTLFVSKNGHHAVAEMGNVKSGHY